MQILLLSILYKDIVFDSKVKNEEENIKLSINRKYIDDDVWNNFYAKQQKYNDSSSFIDGTYLKQNYSNLDSVYYGIDALFTYSKLNSDFSNHIMNQALYNSKSPDQNKKDVFKVAGKNQFYQKELLKSKNEIQLLKNENLKIQSQYQALLYDKDIVVNKYNTIVHLLENKKELLDTEEQYIVRKNFRKSLLVLVLVVSVLLVFFTRLTFIYEERLEASQEKMINNLKFKNRIVAMISHEIRSPLNIISLYCNAISRKIKDTDLKDSIKSIQFTTNSISLMADQVLNFSKSESQKNKLSKSSFRLREELIQISEGLKSLVESNENKLKLNLNINPDVAVYSDVVKIHELFYNIVGNANKFTDKGEIEISATCENVLPDQYKLEVQIKDNGIGMSKGDVENVFEAYYQGEISEKVHNLGLGLGLNLCKELVDLFKGDIYVESEINKGTIVTFNVFLQKCKEESLIEMQDGILKINAMTA
jgi:signal transduction histidine kinase